MGRYCPETLLVHIHPCVNAQGYTNTNFIPKDTPIPILYPRIHQYPFDTQRYTNTHCMPNDTPIPILYPRIHQYPFHTDPFISIPFLTIHTSITPHSHMYIGFLIYLYGSPLNQEGRVSNSKTKSSLWGGSNRDAIGSSNGSYFLFCGVKSCPRYFENDSLLKAFKMLNEKHCNVTWSEGMWLQCCLFWSVTVK